MASSKSTPLEEFIEGKLTQKKYQFVPPGSFLTSVTSGSPIYTKELPLGNSIYATKMKGCFVLYHPEKWPEFLIIESKWQETSGSVDEKFPYLVLNIQQKYPYRTLVLLDGRGYRQEAGNWMRKQVGRNLIAVFGMAEFTEWAKENL